MSNISTSKEDNLRFLENRAQLQLLQRLNNAANSGEPLYDILKIITEGVREIFGYAACDIYLYEKGAAELVLTSISVDSKALKLAEKLTGLTAQNLRVPLFKGSSFYDVVFKGEISVEENIVKVFEDFTANKTLRLLAGKVAAIFGFRSAIRAPLIAKGEVVGVIGVARKSSVTEEDAEVLRMFASQAALIIRKVQAEEALKKSYEEMESKVAQRTKELMESNARLQEALNNVKTLSGLLPICSWCKKVRNDEGYWSQIEAYLQEHSDAQFTHGICPECIKNKWEAEADGLEEAK